LHIIKRVQADEFAEELHNLQTKGRVPRKSNLLSLSLFLDQQDVIRVGGRLANSLVSYDKMHPIILPAKSFFTHLIIAHEHHKQLHAGVQTTLAAVRNKYWPLSARNSIKKYIRSCIICFRLLRGHPK